MAHAPRFNADTNLPPFVRAELALKLKPLIAEKAKSNQAEGGQEAKTIDCGESQERKPTDSVKQNSAEQIETRKVIAEKAGVSHDTISKTEKSSNTVRKKQKPSSVLVRSALMVTFW